MSKWNGRYDSTKESGQSLEQDILDAGKGKITYPTSTGGTVRETDGRIDVYGSSNSSKGHSHSWYDANNGSHGHHD